MLLYVLIDEGGSNKGDAEEVASLGYGVVAFTGVVELACSQ